MKQLTPADFPLIGADGREVPNGCDHFPERFWVWDWKHCCDAHDIAYTIGGTDMDRWRIEADFFGCLAAVNPVIAVVVVLATFLGGYAYWNNSRKRT